MFEYSSFRFFSKISLQVILLLGAILPIAENVTVRSASCPFCAAINATFGEQISKHEITIIAKLVEIPQDDDPDAVEFPKAKFEITRVIKGSDHVAKGMTFKTQLVGTHSVGEQFLVMGVEPPEVMWSTPMKASDRIVKYLMESVQLPAKGADRLVFFQDYFEDDDSTLAFDAYDEFAIADFEELVAMKDRMKREQLVEWIKDPELRVDRRRLYFTMLSVCGGKPEIELLESFIRSDEKEKIRGLDALVSCYLMLKGEAGLALIEEKFLKNSKTDFVDGNGVLSALRFHGTEVKVISPKRIAESARLVLNQIKLADQVIPDLARWEDWSVMDQLVTMFKESNSENEFIRVPVVTYLRACPLPEAKKHLEELAKIDPDAIRRAKFFLGGFEDDESDESTGGATGSDTTESGGAIKSGTSGGSDEDGMKQSSNLKDFEEFQSRLQVHISTDTVRDPDKVLNSGRELSNLNNHQVMKYPLTSANESEDASPGPEANQADSDIPASLTSLSVPNSIGFNSVEQSFVSNPSVSQAPSGSAAFSANEVSESNLPPVAIIHPNLTWWIVFVPIGFSTVIFVVIWSVVNGWFERLIF